MIAITKGRAHPAAFILCARHGRIPCGWKFRHELVTASEVKRNCVRATERGEEAWSVNRVPMNKNRI
ncbi:hypothetical protein NKZ35_30785 [Sinorhizobium meliloti]|uniref:hypothetical protein n=1 Tax=Rhizobium meliloti TaxID=382 RepID=UPI003D6557AA